MHRGTMIALAILAVACSKENGNGNGNGGGAEGTSTAAGAATGTAAGAATGTAAGTATTAVTTAGAASGTAAGADAARVQRGAYLAALGGCGVCHMPMTERGPDMTRPFAGGLEVTEKLPGGAHFTWRASNITPDQATGIGGWTDEQIATAIRQGVRPDGRKLAPIMPYMLYNRLTDEDTRALVAYLRSLAPVANAVEPVDNSKLVAQLPPAPPPRNEPVPADPVGRGAYLATLMHCVMCHTPMGPQGPDMARAFAGGAPMELPPVFGTGVLYTSNITSDAKTGIGAWTEEDIVRAVKTATRPDGRPILGPMAFYGPMWAQLTDQDAADLARFIKSIPPIANQVPPSTFKPAGGPPGGGAGGAPPAVDGSKATAPPTTP